MIRSRIHPYNKIAYGFLWLTLILAGLIFYFIFLKTEIIITPLRERHNTTFLLSVVTDSKQQTDATIIGKIDEEILEEEETFLAKGEKEIAVKSDVLGTVTLINELNLNQPLIATTRLLTENNILLRLKTDIVVPAKSQIEALIYADDKNFSDIIKPTKLTIPGLSVDKQKLVYGQIKDPLGKLEKVAVVRQADIDSARDALAEKLYQKVEEELEKKRATDINFNFIGRVPQPKTVALKEIIAEEVNASADDVNEKFTIKLSVRITQISFDENEIFDLAQKKLIEALPDDKQLVELDKKGFTYVVENYNAQEGIANIKVYASGQMILTTATPALNPELFVRQTITEAREYLEKLPAVERANIHLPGFWQKRLPGKANKIKIKISEDET